MIKVRKWRPISTTEHEGNSLDSVTMLHLHCLHCDFMSHLVFILFTLFRKLGKFVGSAYYKAIIPKYYMYL